MIDGVKKVRMKILVTGANGYLGQGIVKALLDRGNNVIATDFATQHVDNRAQKVACNLFEIEKPYEYFGQPDVLLHLAWRDGFKHYSDAHIEDLPKHYHFIKAMTDAGIQQIAVMGSMHEIGFFEGSIKEDTPSNPITPYGIAKLALREITGVLCKQKNVKFQWLRGYYIVGNSKYGSSIFSKITAAVENGEKEFPFTMGQNQYDFVDYDKFCDDVAAAVSQDKVLGIIEIASGKPEKLADRVERFIRENNYDITLKYGAFPDRPYDSKAIWGNSKKLDEILAQEQ